MSGRGTAGGASARPESMRAWRVHDLGEPADVLRLDDIGVPAPSRGEVLLEVRACGLNFADVLLCRGTYQEHPSLPFTPGSEVVGRIATGPGGAFGNGPPPDTALVPGSRVLARVAPPNGGLAERAIALEEQLLPIPETLDDATAAALHVTYQTAWFALHHRGRLREGETVLVHAGAGGTGSATIQLAAAAGARVIATAGGAEKVALCVDHGADVAIDYRSDDVAPAVLDATGGKGADVIVDPVGGSTFLASTKCVAFEGRIVVVGFASGEKADLRTGHVFVKNYEVLGLHWPLYETHRPRLVREVHDQLISLLEAGLVCPTVSAVRPLPEAPDALTDLAEGRTTGKVVIRP